MRLMRDPAIVRGHSAATSGRGGSFQAAWLFGAPVPTHRARLTLARHCLGCYRFCQNDMRRMKPDVV